MFSHLLEHSYRSSWDIWSQLHIIYGISTKRRTIDKITPRVQKGCARMQFALGLLVRFWHEPAIMRKCHAFRLRHIAEALKVARWSMKVWTVRPLSIFSGNWVTKGNIQKERSCKILLIKPLISQDHSTQVHIQKNSLEITWVGRKFLTDPINSPSLPTDKHPELIERKDKVDEKLTTSPGVVKMFYLAMKHQ